MTLAPQPPTFRTLAFVTALAVVPVGVAGQEPLSTRTMLATPPVAADARESYGPDQLHFGDLYLPDGPGPHPVAVVIHGGCWLALADLDYMSHLARDLTAAGWAVWSLEFRRIDQEGGAWPGILLDVARGADHVRELADRYGLDAATVVAVGHSSGGHLALWLAARAGFPRDELGGEDPLRLRGVIGLAAVADLEEFHGRSDRSCGATIVPALLGGELEERADRLAVTSPAERLPLGVPQLLVSGALDRIVPAGHAALYLERARAVGDDVAGVVIEGAGHFELVAPWTEPYPRVRETMVAFLDRVWSRQ